MKPKRPQDHHPFTRKSSEDFREIFHKVLQFANQGLPRLDFLRAVSRLLLEFSATEEVELRLFERTQHYRCTARRDSIQALEWDVAPLAQNEEGALTPPRIAGSPSDFEALYWQVFRGVTRSSSSHFTRSGSFWTGNAAVPIELPLERRTQSSTQILQLTSEFLSLAVLPIVVENAHIGLMILKSKQPDFWAPAEITFYESLGYNLGVALAHRRAQVALRERVKELTCLYGIAQLVEQPEISLAQLLQGMVDLLPPAWLYPEIAQARILLNSHEYRTSHYQTGLHQQIAEVVVRGERRGAIEVIYTEKRPDLDEGPFLKEERSLIDTIAREVALIIERRQAEEEKAALQEQLRHSDRLATIGQLAAGVAHELNEPLGNILGFAQLAKKNQGLPEQAATDIDKIVKASLYAREVIRKLMLFSRQVPSRKSLVDLNKVVEESLNLLQVRLIKGGIEVRRYLTPELMEVAADASQLNQVLVNLVVNAAQAMPKGGELTIRTTQDQENVYLTVEDTGVGMTEEIQKRIFLPFFTTKDVNQGTGLGLAVVHGIITAHGGTIRAESREGKGTTFTICLPAASLDIREGLQNYDTASS